MGIAWFRGLIVRGRAVAPRPLVRFQSVFRPVEGLGEFVQGLSVSTVMFFCLHR